MCQCVTDDSGELSVTLWHVPVKDCTVGLSGTHRIGSRLWHPLKMDGQGSNSDLCLTYKAPRVIKVPPTLERGMCVVWHAPKKVIY